MFESLFSHLHDNQKAYSLLLVLLITIGWWLNLIRFLDCNFEAPYQSEAVRSFGVFIPPVGGLVGYMSFED